MSESCQVPCQFVQDIATDVKTLKRIVYEGNGESLVTKVTVLEKTMANIAKLSWAILATVLGILGTLILKHF